MSYRFRQWSYRDRVTVAGATAYFVVVCAEGRPKRPQGPVNKEDGRVIDYHINLMTTVHITV